MHFTEAYSEDNTHTHSMNLFPAYDQYKPINLLNFSHWLWSLDWYIPQVYQSLLINNDIKYSTYLRLLLPRTLMGRLGCLHSSGDSLSWWAPGTRVSRGFLDRRNHFPSPCFDGCVLCQNLRPLSGLLWQFRGQGRTCGGFWLLLQTWLEDTDDSQSLFSMTRNLTLTKDITIQICLHKTFQAALQTKF